MGKRKPVIENVQIVSFGHKGLTIGKTPTGEAVLVEDAVPGDVVNYQVRRKKKGMKLGHVAEFVEKSKHRVEPVCEHFDVCGGCSWQNLEYKEQCQQKQDIVTNAIHRIGQLPDTPILSIIGGDPEYYYRNKVEYTFANKRWLTVEEISSGEIYTEGGLGFHKAGLFDKVVNIEKCHLQGEPSNAIRNATRIWASENDLSYYDYKNHTGQLRNLIVRLTRTGEVMVILVTGTKDRNVIDSFHSFLSEEFPQVQNLVWMVNTKWNDALHDVPFEVIKGPGYIMETLDEVKYKIGPKSFFQTNPYQAEVLFRAVKTAADLKPTDILYDLYCGVGSIGLFMAHSCRKVIGVEEIPEAIEDAKLNAELNGFENTYFQVGDVGALVDQEFLSTHGSPDVVITDPPRAGMHENVVHTLISAKVPRLVYVSCNPATQARDLKLLSEAYDVISVQPVDMFPQTNHVESIAILKPRS